MKRLGLIILSFTLLTSGQITNADQKVKIMDIINDDSLPHTIYVSGKDSDFPGGLRMNLKAYSVTAVPHDGIDIGDEKPSSGNMHYDNNPNITYQVTDIDRSSILDTYFKIEWASHEWDANTYTFTQRAYVDLHIHPSAKYYGGLIFNHTDHVQK